jgi:hypothetical protein
VSFLTRRPGRHRPHPVAAAAPSITDVTDEAAEGQTGTCRKCHRAITFLGGDWTCTEGEMYGLTNCGADLSAPYAPHEPGGAAESLDSITADIGRALAAPPSFAAAVAERLQETAAGSPEAVARVTAGLLAMDEPAPPAAPEPSGVPSAWMRSWQHDGGVLPVALWGRPSFAGLTAGHRLAGVYLGGADTEGRFAIDGPSAEWWDDLIAAAQQARDALVYEDFRTGPADIAGGAR